jgi:dienelactone hydrolase
MKIPVPMAAAIFAASAVCFNTSMVQTQPSAPKLKDEMRMPWTRSDERYLRFWLVAGSFHGALGTDFFKTQEGEASLRPTDGQEVTQADGSVRWHSQRSWSDEVGFEGLTGPRDSAVAYAFTNVGRSKTGNALLSLGSSDGIRVWVNGKLVLARDGMRSSIPDEDQVEVPMVAGDNRVLIKVSAAGTFYARVLEPGSVLPRRVEIGPSIIKASSAGFTLRTDINADRVAHDAVKVEVIKPGGQAVFESSASRGDMIDVDAADWEDGPYEVRCTSHTSDGLLFASFIPWYKGDFLPKARELAATAAVADVTKPEGFTLKMLVDMVKDRLGCGLDEVKGNPWRKVHSPLMEFDEMMLEREGVTGRIRPYGFVRLAYTDDVDGSPQFARAYLPAAYDPGTKWPLVIHLHGYNPANPIYVRWWSADARHAGIDTEFPDRQEVIYIEPHGRGNTQYLGLGDSDILRVIAEAKRLFNVDEDRIYLSGDSMGGWGTWNVGTRHPDLFAAIGPVFGGVDYHAQMSEEDLARLSPIDRFLGEKSSSWAMADGLLNVPIFVRHGDADQAVNVDWSRWGVRLLQRWGYDVRYHEYPGRIHEALENNNGNVNIGWFLQHRRTSDLRHVRIRSAELRNASAYWVHILQADNPLAFMVVDAEVVDRNLIRLDTENILDIELTPTPAIINADEPVRVVWNGISRVMNFGNGALRLTRPDYAPGGMRKNPGLPGTIADFTVTPFAVVVGTTAQDTAMASLCSQKADAFVEAWKDWQKQPPRVFADTAITDEEMARYSLLLVGGADANQVASRLADRIPLQVTSDRISVDGKKFAARDAAVQLIYPNPLNADRYVLVASATSADGMYFNDLNPQRLASWDYVIADGRIPAHKQRATALQTMVVSGMFDHGWKYRDAFAQPGDSTIRATGRLRHRPNINLVINPKVLNSYRGRYQITDGPLVEITSDGKALTAQVQGAPGSGDILVPETETNFVLQRYNVWISFVKNSKGKVTGLVGFQNGDFEATKLE